MSSRVTSRLILMPEFKGRALFGGGLASGLGKKRYYNRVAFSWWLDVGRLSAFSRSSSFGGVIRRKLRSLAHLLTC